MSTAEMRFIKRCAEWVPKDERINIPKNTRGIYVLFHKSGVSFDVVYVGMARGEKTGMYQRIAHHAKSKRKGSHWSHFSIFEVHDNISVDEVEELEGLFRHIYRKDQNANIFNRQKRHHKLFRIRENNLKLWKAA
jgi:hypothetical protein